MRICVPVVDDVFDTGLASILDTFEIANELGGERRFDVTIASPRARVRTHLGFTVPVTRSNTTMVGSGSDTAAAKDESGDRVQLEIEVVGKDRKPTANALVYVYHPSARGWYSDKAFHVRANSGDQRRCLRKRSERSIQRGDSPAPPAQSSRRVQD